MKRKIFPTKIIVDRRRLKNLMSLFTHNSYETLFLILKYLSKRDNPNHIPPFLIEMNDLSHGRISSIGISQEPNLAIVYFQPKNEKFTQFKVEIDYDVNQISSISFVVKAVLHELKNFFSNFKNELKNIGVNTARDEIFILFDKIIQNVILVISHTSINQDEINNIKNLISNLIQTFNNYRNLDNTKKIYMDYFNSLHEKFDKIQYLLQNLNQLEYPYYEFCSLLGKILKIIKNNFSANIKNISIFYKGEKVNIDKELNLRANAVICSLWLEIILNNLISNALKYGITDENKSVHIYIERKNKFIIISVRDFGVGVAYDRISKLFDFDSLPVLDNSTHVGLPTVAELARKLGGKIEYNPANPGSLFTLTFQDIYYGARREKVILNRRK